MLPSVWRRRDREPLLGLRSEIDQLFEDFFDNGVGARSGLMRPSLGESMLPTLDLRETDDALILEAELPGVKPSDLDVHVSDGALVIRGERKQEKDEKTRAWHRSERYYGRFERAFMLPSNVEPENVEATYQEGVLKIVVPKKANAREKTVPVKIRAADESESGTRVETSGPQSSGSSAGPSGASGKGDGR